MGLFGNTSNVITQGGEPASPTAGMIWIETDANENWRRNDANNAWVSFVNDNTITGFSTITKDVVTSDDTTISTTFVDSNLSVTLPDDDKLFIAIATCEVSNSSAGSNVKIQFSGGDDVNEMLVNTHDTAGRRSTISTITSGTQSGQTLKIQWDVGAGTGTMFVGSALVVIGVA